jgi:ornithine carbamoyltransferase
VKKDLLRILDLNGRDLLALLASGRAWKRKGKLEGAPRPLAGKSWRDERRHGPGAFEVGMARLGGHALFLSPADTQIGRGEPVRDTARVLSRYVDAIVIRTFRQETVEEMAAWASIPVINGLTDDHHPCQVLADLMTAQERGIDLRRMKVAFIGDGNNVAHSWVEAAHLLGFSLRVACPKGFEPNANVLREAAAGGKGDVRLVRDPAEAAKSADIVVTDVWTSMGQEKERRRRLEAFRGYRVDAGLLRNARKDAIVMHCLPAHRGEEITEEVIEGPRSAVFDEAENRMHVQIALLARLIPH